MYAKLLPEGVGNGELMAEGEGSLSLGAGDKRYVLLFFCCLLWVVTYSCGRLGETGGGWVVLGGCREKARGALSSSEREPQRLD